MKLKIKKGDTVEIITGREQDRGKQGEVIKVLPKKNRLVVEGLNMRKKHQRQIQTEGKNVDVGIIEFEGQLSVSNVMLVCPKCNTPSRIGIVRDDAGLPHRVCKSCKEEID